MEYKMAEYRYYINRMNKLQLNKKPDNRMANQTQDSPQQELSSQKNNNTQKTNRTQKYSYKTTKKHREKKWTTFTYYNPKIRKITNLFKLTDINIAFQSNNSIRLTNTDTTNKNTEIQIQWYLRTNMQNM
jgi:hypothetical protein